MSDIENDDFWKNVINSIPQDLSPKGLEAPVMESDKSTFGEAEGHLSKVSFDCFMFLSPETGKYYLVQTNQKYTDIGDMSLNEALRMIKYKNRKK